MRSVAIVFGMAAVILVAGCGSTKGNPAAEAPPPAPVEREQDAHVIHVDRPESFSLIAANLHDAASELAVTRAVKPDIAKMKVDVKNTAMDPGGRKRSKE
ncbi:MAG: hypothetical protein ACRD5M_04375 [Candidatus Acidiferrales bacterium]